MSFFKKNLLVKLGLIALLLVGLSAAIFLSQRQSDNRSRASRTVVVSFTPSSTQSTPINIPTGSTGTLDIMLDPGTSQVSYFETELNYDATKFRVDDGGFTLNTDAFSQYMQRPVYSSGKVSFAVSVGSDSTRAIQSPAKVGTLTIRAISQVSSSELTFSQGTQAFSIDPNSSFGDNVMSNTVPAYLSASGTTTVSPSVPPTSCSNNPSDTMLVIDKSGSMTTASVADKITQAKTAAKNYVDIISADTRNKIGLVSYENTATLDSPLTDNYASVKSKIDQLDAIGSTCTECAIKTANQALANAPQKKVVILLTDGKANFVEGNPNQVDVALAEQRALAAAAAGHNAGIVYYTIGLGQEINGAFLQQIANTTGGKYFPSPTADQLNNIYNQISQIAGQGSVTGFVFNDANNNRAFDSTESKLSGWTLQLTRTDQQSPTQTFTSDANGFNITGLCNGTYNLKEVVQSGWRQTLPTDPNGYTINITNGGAVTDRNFGNNQGNTCSDNLDNNNNNLIDIQDPSCHTDGNPDNPSSYDPTRPENGNTCADKIDNNGNNLIDRFDPICHTDGNPDNPASYDPTRPESGGNGTSLSLTLFLHGLGNSGDNVNPFPPSCQPGYTGDVECGSNRDPQHKTRIADVQVYNTNNQLVANASGEIKYQSATGDFRGTVITNNPLTPGNYNVRVQTNQHLIRLIPGIQTLTAGANQLPVASLVTGDILKDNKLNIQDYNLLIGCHSAAPDPTCTGELNIKTDLNDNGVVDMNDYNLFLREIANQPGE